MEPSTLIDILSGHRWPLNNEKDCQLAIADELTAKSLPFEQEVRLSPGSIIDFLVGGEIGIECKLRRTPKTRIFKQLRRYAEHDQIKSLILVSNTAMGLPAEIEGKPAYMVSLGRAWM